MYQIALSGVVTVVTLGVAAYFMTLTREPAADESSDVIHSSEGPLWRKRTFADAPVNPRDRGPNSEEALDLESPSSQTGAPLVFTEEKVATFQDAERDSTEEYVVISLVAVGALGLFAIRVIFRRSRRPRRSRRSHRSHRSHRPQPAVISSTVGLRPHSGGREGASYHSGTGAST